MFQARFLVGAVLAGWGAEGITWRMPLAAGVWFFAAMFAYLLNGYADAVEDRANGSDRPLASGQISARTVRAGAYSCAGAAMTGALFVGGPMPLLTGAFLLLGCAYSASPLLLKKSTVGTMFTVLAAGALTYLTPFALCWNGTTGDIILLTFGAVMSMWMGMVGAFVKDLSDVIGDSAGGRRTAAIVWGENRVRIIASLSALAIGIAFFTVAEQWAHLLLLSAIVLVFGALLLTICALTRFSHGSRVRRRRPYRVFMATQYMTHAVAVLSHV